MSTGPQYGIVGNDYGIDLPLMDVPDEILAEERNRARFSKSREFKVLKEHIENRIVFYQTFLPNGRPVNEAPVTAEEWRIANAIIGEFRAIIAAYETAAEVLKKDV